MLLSGCYDIPAVEVFVTGARTNKVPTGPTAAPGGRRRRYLIETTIDAAARQLGIDRDRAAPAQPRALVPVQDRARLDVRLRRLRALPRPALELLGPRCDRRFTRTARQPVPAWRRRPTRRTAARRFVGVAAARSSGATCSSARASRSASSAPAACSSTRGAARGRRVLVTVGSTPTGQGHETLFAQIAADRLGVDPERVTVRTGDTDALADGVGSFASRTTVMGGSAVAAAADDLLARRAGRRALRVRPGLRLRRLRGRGRGRRARPGRCACGGWSPSTTRGGSSTRCWPRVR